MEMTGQGAQAIEPFEVYALLYATARRRHGENFIVPGDPHEDASIRDFHYYVWLARNSSHCFVIDTGFTKEVCEKRGGGRRFLVSPDEPLRKLGVDADAVRDVIVTHLHYDHIGNFALFPNAWFHLQDKEMEYATGRLMAHRLFAAAYEVEDIKAMVGQVFAGRVQFHDGDAILAPGLSVHHIGGHAKGLQSVRIFTRIGWMVLASDAAHLYATMEQERPFPIIHDLEALVRGWTRLRELADDPRFIVPGHDAEVMARYPAVPGLEGLAVRLDNIPQTPA